MGEQSQATIAEFLGVTANTVKTRLYSARLRLRTHMSEIEKQLGGTRPSGNPAFAEAVRRMIQPEALKQPRPWPWSPGIGTDVWEMFCACTAGDLETVNRLVARDPSLVRSHYEYRTPLSFAARENQLAVAEFLLDHGALQVQLGDPVQMAKDRGHTEMARLIERKMEAMFGGSEKGEPVVEAIRKRDAAAVRRLLDESPGLLHAGDRTSSQPIHWAVMTRQLGMIDDLLTRGADINAARVDGARPIHLTNGDYNYRGWRDVPGIATTPKDVFKHLVARGAYVDVWMAALTGDIARVRELIDADPGVINRTNDCNTGYGGSGSIIKNAASGGNMNIVRLLLERGADPNLPEEGMAPHGGALYAAVTNGDYDMAKLLLEYGAHPNPPVESSGDAVWIAIRDGREQILRLLASHGAVWDIPIRLDGSLTYKQIVATGLRRSMKILAHYGDAATATPLIEADPTLADDVDALSGAAENGHGAFVSLLLEHSPATARKVMVSKPRAMAELLFTHGMDPNRPDWMRSTPLHHFARGGDVESAALYLDHGANIEAQDGEFRSTPLAAAAERGEKRMVEFLLRRGARVNPSGSPAWATPIAWAERRGHKDVVKVLAEHEGSGALPERTIEDCDAVAHDLVKAFAGDEAALDRIVEYFRFERQLRWDKPTIEEQVNRLRRGVMERLHNAGIAGGSPDVLSIEAARVLIARSEGFADWPALVSSLAPR